MRAGKNCHTFSRIVETNQRFACSRKMAESQQKQVFCSVLTCGILTCPLINPYSPALKNNSPAFLVSGSRMELHLFKTLIPKELSLFDVSGGSLKATNRKGCLYLTWLGVCPVLTASPLGSMCVKQLQVRVLTLQLSQVMNNS